LTEHTRGSGRAAERPLLSGDTRDRLAAMLAARAPLYRMADYTIDTGASPASEVAQQAVSASKCLADQGRVPELSLDSPSGRSDIYVGRDVRLRIPVLLQARWPRAKRVWVISDTAVAESWADELLATFEQAGLAAHSLTVPPGES